MKIHPLVLPVKPVSIPFYADLISAGFPSPAADYIDSGIDLVSHLIAHPSSTYVLRVAGDSMRDAGILDGSLLLVTSAFTRSTTISSSPISAGSSP